VPDHQVHCPVGQRLRLRDETLHHHTTKTDQPIEPANAACREGERKKRSRGGDGESRGAARTCGWFLRHALRSSARRPRAIPPPPDMTAAATAYPLPRLRRSRLVFLEIEPLVRCARFVFNSTERAVCCGPACQSVGEARDGRRVTYARVRHAAGWGPGAVWVSRRLLSLRG
jgi:hypothetical protein